MVLLFLCLGVLFCYLSHRIIMNVMKASRYSRIPWPKVKGRRFLIGNAIGDRAEFAETLDKWAREYGSDGIFEFNIFGTNIYGISNERIASQIERKRPFIMTRRRKLVNILENLGVAGLFSAEGETWRRDRRVVAPSLSHKNVHDYVNSIKLVASRLVTKWGNQYKSNNNSVICANKEMVNATIDVISLVAFAMDTDLVTKNSSEIANITNKLFELVLKRVLSPVLYWNIPLIGQYLDEGKYLKDEAIRICDQFIENFEASNIEEDEQLSNTFLGKMMTLNKSNDSSKKMSHERFVGNLLTMFSAGSETTATTLTVSLYEIANNEDLQNELIHEAEAIQNFESAGFDTFMNELPRLRSLVYEVLRLEGPVPIIIFESSEPIEVEGVLLPSHSLFAILYKHISRYGYSDIEEKRTPKGPLNSPLDQFCAQRWLVKNDDNSLSVMKPTFNNGFRAFGSGARVCPGRDLAEIEILVILSSILRSFKISLEENHPTLTFKLRFGSVPSCDVRLRLSPRS